MKNVELTDWSSERRADDSDFIAPSVHRDFVYKGNLTIPVFWIYFCYKTTNWSGHA